MGCDVYLFKVDQAQLSNKMSESIDVKTSFDKYVNHQNIKGNNYFKLDAETIIKKTQVDLYQLSRDEFWQILLWINYSTTEIPELGLQFENENIKLKLNEFGFTLIEDFQDNTRVFLFALGDFLHGYYNDFEDLTRTYACLTISEFNMFLDYISYLYATVLTEVDNQFNYPMEREYLLEIIDSCSRNTLLKDLVEKKSKYIIETKSREPDGIVFDIHSSRKIYFGNLDGAIYRCQTLKKQLKENIHPVLILDSQ